MAIAAFIIGAILGSGSPAADAAARFADAWARQDFSAMHAELTDDTARRYPMKRFTKLYEEAETTATLSSVEHGDPDGPHSVSDRDVVTVPLTLHTNAFGDLSGHLDLPVDGDSIAWEPNLVFPGVGRGEQLARRMQVPKRAPILAKDGTPLAEGSAAARSSPIGAAATSVVGETGAPKRKDARALAMLGFPPGSSTGISGIEQAFNQRLAGKPGGQLLAAKGSRGGGRELASSEPVDGEPVHTTVDPDVQRATVSALGSTYGGVAVLDAQKGSVLGLAGIAFSAPQPPGSSFKVVTTTAGLDAGVVKLSDEFPVQTSTNVEGREIANAYDEPCGGNLTESFAESCNTVFAPLGVDVGAERLVSTAEDFGFNSTPELFNAEATAIVKPPESTIPTKFPSDLDLAVSAIGQGEVLATPLELASISQTIAAGGTRSPTALVTDRGLGPDAKPVEVTSRATAGTVRDLMVQVVTSGTGQAAALPGIQVAGKTGTAELGPKPFSSQTEPTQPGAQPEQKVDAWFTSFAPAGAPKLAVGVMVVNADGDGGEVAAPIAREVLASGLG
jgi:penicillin-binding protein A